MDVLLIGPIVISIVSLVVAALAYGHGVLAKRSELAHGYASFKLQRNLSFEAKLEDWEEGFELYGIDLNAAKGDGVAKSHILYLVLCLNAQSASATALGVSVLEYIEQSAWRRHMYDQEITRKTWKYARWMFEDFTVKAIDEYLARQGGRGDG